MADDNLKAERPEFELKPDIDESRLTDDEKNMLADLRDVPTNALPPSLDVPQLETKSEEKVTVLDADLPPAAKVAENIPAPFPVQEKMEATSLEDPPPPPDPPFAQEEEAEEGKVEEEESLSSGFENPMDNCPHCGWDLSLQSVVEPGQDEKMGFLHSVLGQKTFIQEYSLFGGKVHVRFRTLTTKEMDVIYNYVFQQRESGEIETIQDYWEKVNRYRLYLQLIYLSASDGSFTHQLPDAYSKESNPHATDFWQFPAYDPEVGYLDQIEDRILKEVLRTESIQRTISTYCARFNRLVSKLEVMIDNPDFWKETEQQS